ncbi:MAG: hypothetical protein SF069_06485 [Phycisphaerae bacterium]|nr:hypothetical protein [Phycisphaerae bacterium]
MACFVFLCDLKTEQECLERSLFGTNVGESHRLHLSRVVVGDQLLLYNIETGMLRGAFAALTACTFNIEPKAWKRTRRSFPWQVRVDATSAFAKPISADELVRHVPLTATAVGLLPPSELTQEQTERVLTELRRANGA